MLNNWGQLLKIQDDISKEQDNKKKQQQKIYQQLYKQQLEQMLKNQRQNKKHLKHQDHIIIEYANQKKKSIEQKQYQQRKKWDIMRQNFSNDNFQSSQQRKIKQKLQIQSEKKKFDQRFKRLSTQVHTERQYQKRNHSLKQIQLAQIYQQQLQDQNRRKSLNRLQDKRIEELAKRIQDEKQHQRMNTLNRIRFGYIQDKKVYQISQKAQQQKLSQRNKFLYNLQNPKPLYLYSQGCSIQQNPQKQQLLQETSHHNHTTFQQKHLIQKQSLYTQTLQQHKKLQNLNQQLQYQQRRKQQQKDKQRKELQEELERQIQETERRKMNNRFMNHQEQRINSSLYGDTQNLLLPGVKYDHAAQRQQVLIERFLRGNRKATQPSYAYYQPSQNNNNSQPSQSDNKSYQNNYNTKNHNQASNTNRRQAIDYPSNFKTIS